MRAKVRGFRGCEKADIDIDRIALLAGLNGAGKSSVCQAIAAAACGAPIPFFNSSRPDKPRYTKADAKALLRGGMEAGVAVLEVDGNVVSTVAWPALSFTGTDSAHCSLVAAGLVNPMEMEEADRQKFFSTLLNADPTLGDLVDTLKEAIPALTDPDYGSYLAKITTMVQTNGWDVAHKHFKENGARRKGEWEGKSGESFGAKKAADWKPQGWRDDLADKTLEELGTACTQAQEKVEKAVAAVATDAASLAQLVEQANGEAAAWNALQEANTALSISRDDYKTKAAKHADIEIPTATACPHCGGFLDIKADIRKGGFSVVESTATLAEIESAQQAAEAAGVLAKQAKTALDARQTVYNSAKGAHDARKGATEHLAEAKKRTGTTDVVDVARDYLAGLVRDKDLVDRRAACETLAGQIQANQKLVDILSPEGLRRQKLQKALKVYNKTLAGLSTAADFGTVTIDDELEILYGGRRYFLLSQSEQYRVRAVVQISVAINDQSPLVIFDGADIMDQDGRNGLFAMMGEADVLCFVVGMTVLSKKNVPDLAKAELGASYWIADGIAAPL